MEKFQFENYRDGLAKELKKIRKREGGKEDAKEKLKEEKNNADYEDAKKFHRIRNELPRHIVNEAMDYLEGVDNPAMWDVEDISDKIPGAYKLIIDKHILHDISYRIYPNVEGNEARWDIDRRIDKIREQPESENRFEREQKERLLKEEIENFLDTLTDHRLLDGHNINHGVMGNGGTAEHFRAKAFNRYGKIEASSAENYNNGFWTCIAGGYYSALGNPAVIFSPNNIATRSFFEQKFDPPIEDLLEGMAEKEKQNPSIFLRNLKSILVFEGKEFKGFNVSSYQGNPDFARILFLAGLPFASDGSSGKSICFPFESRKKGMERRKRGDYSKVPIEESWMDIADCIIDLRQKKVWKRKYSKEELDQVETEKERYKKWIEENLLNCTFEELISSEK